MQKKSRRYVQFSKIIVVTVTAAVTLICVAGMVMCFARGDTGAVVDLGRAYISYALVVFAAYSGNSAIEKWLLKKYAGNQENGSTDTTTAEG